MLGSRGSARFVVLGLVITASAGACLHAWDDIKVAAGGAGGAGGTTTTSSQSSTHTSSSTGEGSTEQTTTSNTTSTGSGGGGGAGGSMSTTSSSGATGPCPGGAAALGEIAVSCAQVNVHGMPGGTWTPDPDCTSGCNVVTLAYCQKFYPATSQLVALASTTDDDKPFFSANCPDPPWDYPGTGQYACCP